MKQIPGDFDFNMNLRLTDLLSHFSKIPNDPYNLIFDILEDPNHVLYQSMKRDLENISTEEFGSFCERYHLEDDEVGIIWFLSERYRNQIGAIRYQKLVSQMSSERPEPYASRQLASYPIDKNGLIELKLLEPCGTGVQSEGTVFTLCPALPSFNACYWLFQLIQEETFINGKNFKVRLDPLINLPKNEYPQVHHRMNIYGKTLEWKRIRELKNEEYGQWLGDWPSSKTVGHTDYVWSPAENEVHFTCEELPVEEQSKKRGSRYFHAIFDKSSGMIIHCDGAIRLYQSHEFEGRLKHHVRNAEARKVGTRIKIFQIDEPISQELFMNLATNFMVWNYDLLRYFNQDVNAKFKSYESNEKDRY